MKLQYLAIIFLIIILPIVIVLSAYVDYHIDAINLKHTYDTKLLDATYDSLKFYQLNTVSNAISDISASKIEELEAAVKTFYNSLSTTYGYTGYKSSVMEDYVPTVVFAMYDGYYIYSPYRNVLTGVPSEDVGMDYENNKILHGLKSYVYYSCRYKIDNDNDFVITYTLDNYITIQGTIDGDYVNKHGYLIDGITQKSEGTNISSEVTDASGNVIYDFNGDGSLNSEDKTAYDYAYDDITFQYNDTEELKEYLGDTEYSYAKLNGTKYYLDGDEVFYINASGERAVQAKDNTDDTDDTYDKYKKFIKNNNSAYRYYNEAYNFTKWVREKLSGLTSEDAVDANGDPISDFGLYTIFREDEEKFIQDYDSDFNQHRSAVIRYTIEKNLSTAIAGYNNYFENSEAKFIMPNISETDWEIIENNISMITFLQGFKIGGRDYNEYCVVANNLTKEYVDENDIYILGNNHTYYKVNDKTIPTLADSVTYKPGVWKLNFEQRIYLDTNIATGEYIEDPYYPMSYDNDKPYLGSYSSIIASTSVDTSESDMYKYLRNNVTDYNLKNAYYTALARERYGQYSVNNNINIIEVISFNKRVVTLPTLIETGETVSGDTTLEDENGDIIVIPEGFHIADDSGETVDEGIVVVAPDGSEFVWVPVEDVNTMYGTDENGRKLGKLYNFTSSGYIAYNWREESGVMKWTLTSGTNSYREPEYLPSVTDADGSRYNTVGITEDLLQNEFNEMINSVEKNKGFYIGRYETSLTADGNAQSKKNKTSATAASSRTHKWYGLYQKEKEYSEKNSLTEVVGSSMIWGSQYDQMMIWMQKNGINITSTTAPVSGASRNTSRKTGSVETDKLNNIYDLIGNSSEWTLEADYSNTRVARGGNINVINQSPAMRSHIRIPTNSGNDMSSRITLYIK